MAHIHKMTYGHADHVCPAGHVHLARQVRPAGHVRPTDYRQHKSDQT